MSIKKKNEIQFDDVKEEIVEEVEQLSEIEILKRQIEELKQGLQQAQNPNGEDGRIQVYGNKHTGKLWGYKIIVSPRSSAYKNLSYLNFSINGRVKKINFNEPVEVEVGIYETIKMHEDINKVVNSKTGKTEDKNVHYVAQLIGEIYR